MAAPSSSAPAWLNKSSATNLISAICIVIGLLLPEPLHRPVLHIGLFALSGAITNWLAIYMLFEKIPGLYGSGVIPARFEDFKREIHRMLMEQFFNAENFERFMRGRSGGGESDADAVFDLGPIIEKTDLSPAFEALVEAVEESAFGSMLSMVGGTAALEPLKEPFSIKMKDALTGLARQPAFQQMVRSHLSRGGDQSAALMEQVDAIVQQRLDELTPQIVKEIMQQMIREHLGWLVIWGGVFGGLIGLITAFIPIF